MLKTNDKYQERDKKSKNSENMKFKKLSIFVTLLVALAGCLSTPESEFSLKVKENDAEITTFLKTGNINATKTAEGVYYVITQANANGRAIKTSDLVTIKYKMTRLGSTLAFNETKAGETLTITFAVENNIFNPGLFKMKEGEKLSMWLTHDLAFGDAEFTNLPKFSPVQIDMEVVKVSTEGETIAQYLTDNKLTPTEVTSEGIRIIKTKLNPSGAEILAGQTVTLTYKGQLLYKIPMVRINTSTNKESIVYDSVFDSGTASFALVSGTGGVIDGFWKGIVKFRNGEEGTIIFPSSLGYKNQTAANGNIPAGSPLRFDISGLK